MTSWRLHFVGLPWWLILPLGAWAVWAMWRWQRPELAAQSQRLRRLLLALRCAAVGLVALLLLEPTLARTARVRELPLVAVLLDQSGSMDIPDSAGSEDSLRNEAAALGLAPAEARALTRLERAARLIQSRVLPVLDDRARVRVFGFDQQLRPLDLAKTAPRTTALTTDFEGPLAELARQWAQEHIGGVLLVSDGRQTAGRDPASVLRSLRARGATLSALRVGEAQGPPDAVVAEVAGSHEVFLQEVVGLDAKWRVTGGGRTAWDLVLSENGKEVQRRAVEPRETWQYTHFETPAKQAGVAIYQVRLEPRRAGAGGAPPQPTGAVTRELWFNLPGSSLDDLVQSGALDRPLERSEQLDSLDAPRNIGDNFGSRIRGFLYPPATGAYTFFIASDDASELWLGRDADPASRRRLAGVASWTAPRRFDAEPSQRSEPVRLEAGRAYYLEVWHKEGSGDDHLTVGWELPGGAQEVPIPGSRLAPWRNPGRATAPAGAPPASHQPAEATVANNAAELAVAVNQDPLRVFLADATPRWETRYLAALFERDRRVKLERRYHSVLSSQPGVAFLPKTQSEWDGFDLVVLGDLDSRLLPPQQQQFCADYVARRGGFLVCVAGPRGMPRSFTLGPLAGALPVRGTGAGVADSAPVSVELAPPGRGHPITTVLNDPAFNERLWPALPPLHWIAGAVAAKPGATVLLAAQNPARTPLVALQRYGAGRVLWMGTGESWRWRDRLGDRVHHTFWLQAMRWGLAARLRGQDPRLQAGLDRALLAPGETAELRARITTGDGTPVPAPPRVRLERLDAAGAVVPESVRSVEMRTIPESASIWQCALADLPEGHWRATITSGAPAVAGLGETRELLVRPQPGQELLELGADAAALARLAELGGGQAGGFADVDAIVRGLAERLKPRDRDLTRTYSLWDNYAVLVVLVGVLGVEWVLRKRNGLP